LGKNGVTHTAHACEANKHNGRAGAVGSRVQKKKVFSHFLPGLSKTNVIFVTKLVWFTVDAKNNPFLTATAAMEATDN
jgi:hypothetical protein